VPVIIEVKAPAANRYQARQPTRYRRTTLPLHWLRPIRRDGVEIWCFRGDGGHRCVYNSRLREWAKSRKIFLGEQCLIRFAERIDEIEPFRVMEVLTRAKTLEAQGRDIVHLEVGEPDFVTAHPIIDAAKIALERGHTFYTQPAGIPELRSAIAQWYADRHGVEISPQRIIVTPGASGALLLAVALLLNPGRGLLMSDPGYPCNRNFLSVVNAEAQLVPVGPDDRYQLSAAQADRHWRENTAGVLVASPANPSGEILARDELRALFELCRRRNGALIVDEIYHGLTYSADAASILEITDQAFVINSFSKYFGMTGWRLGWMVAPLEAMPALERLAQNLFISPPASAQYAALAAFGEEAQAIFRERRAEFGRRRDFLLGHLRRLGFVIPHTPAGALYLYADVTKFTRDSEGFCLDLLERHGIAVTPGTDFGRYRAREHVRFAYTTALPRLEEAVRRFDKIFG
jgi:aspartate/methionine/tyrosine aminotransferase